MFISLLVYAYCLADLNDGTVSSVGVKAIRLSIIIDHPAPLAPLMPGIQDPSCYVVPPPNAALERVPGTRPTLVVGLGVFDRGQTLHGAKVWGT